MWLQRESNGPSTLHFAVWEGDVDRARALLDSGASPSAVDADGLTPWDWAEAKGFESMMEILIEYGGGPLPVWTLHVEPSQQAGPGKPVWSEKTKIMPWSSNVRKAVVQERSLVLPEEQMWLHCRNIAGESVCRCCFPKDASVACVIAGITQETGRSATLILTNNHIIGLDDHHRTLSDLLDSPPSIEKRKDRDGQRYTKHEFFKYYGSQKGQRMWAMAAPSEVEVACAQSLAEVAEVQNGMISEALSKSLRGVDEGEHGVTRVFPAVMDMDHGDEVGAQRDAGCCAGHVERVIHAGSDIDGENDHTIINHDDIHEEPVWLYPYMRTPKEFMTALLTGPDFENIRRIMDDSKCPYIHKESGAKIFVWPEHYKTVLEALARSDAKLRSSHIIVAQSFLTNLEKCVARLPSRKNVRVKKDGISLVFGCQANPTASSSAANVPGLSLKQDMEETSLNEMALATDASAQDVKLWEDILCVERTFLCLSKTYSSPDSVTQSTTEAHRGGMNPRRLV